MRILIATHHLVLTAGTETYVRTLATALARRDHVVTVYSPFVGAVADDIRRSGIPVTDDIGSLRHEFFSVAHVHHNVIATQVRATLPDVPIVWVRHGLIPELERPPTFVPEVSLGIARERARALTADEGHEVSVVPNPIDTDFFAPGRPIRPQPKTAVAITNHLSSSAWSTIELACRTLDVEVRHVGYPDNQVEDVREPIDQADIVFAVGRTALEAGSMARAVLIHDHHGCDGWLDRSNYKDAAEFAFSGHRSWRLPSAEELAQLISDEYSTEKGREAREVVFEHHALDVVVPELERHYRRAIEIGRANGQRPVAFAPTLADQFAFYQHEIRMLRAAVEASTAGRKTSEAELAQTQAELERSDHEASALRASLASISAELERVYAGNSWRLTKPLRRLRAVGRRSRP
jgi:hypothetical protein